MVNIQAYIHTNITLQLLSLLTCLISFDVPDLTNTDMKYRFLSMRTKMDISIPWMNLKTFFVQYFTCVANLFFVLHMCCTRFLFSASHVLHTFFRSFTYVAYIFCSVLHMCCIHFFQYFTNVHTFLFSTSHVLQTFLYTTYWKK